MPIVEYWRRSDDDNNDDNQSNDKNSGFTQDMFGEKILLLKSVKGLFIKSSEQYHFFSNATLGTLLNLKRCPRFIITFSQTPRSVRH